MSPPKSGTAADALTEFHRRVVRDNRMSFRRRMECAAGGPPGEVKDAEWAFVEILLRPLINGEKDIVHRSEEPRAGAVGFKLIWREG